MDLARRQQCTAGWSESLYEKLTAEEIAELAKEHRDEG